MEKHKKRNKGKEEAVGFDEKEEKSETKSGKRTIIIIMGILIIVLLLLGYFFFSQYHLSQKRIRDIFEKSKKPSDVEFDSGSFSSLIDACIGREVGDLCELSSDGETAEGICKLSGNNNTVCIIS